MRKYETPAAVGGSSLLVIFAVLCLVVFALLGCATVQADGRLSAVSARGVENYYRADAAAEEILAQLRAGTIPDGVERDGERYSYHCPISENQRLEVVVDVSQQGYEVQQWCVRSVTDWEQEADAGVWNGEITG